MRLLSARSGVRIPPSTPSCELSPYIRAFFLFIDSFENLFENLYKKKQRNITSLCYKYSGILPSLSSKGVKPAEFPFLWEI